MLRSTRRSERSCAVDGSGARERRAALPTALRGGAASPRVPEPIRPAERDAARSHSPRRPRFGVALLIAFLSVACDGKQTASSRRPTAQSVSDEPSTEELINAVRSYLSSKMMVEQRGPNDVPGHWVSERHSCSQLDVDRDPYMPQNPELAKCPRVGAVRETRLWKAGESTHASKLPCPVPAAGPGWDVRTSGDDWEITYGGRRWKLRKASGSAVGVEGVVRVAAFVLSVTSFQEC
jgi:hypothetical protein